jgi:WD40 repeat protein
MIRFDLRNLGSSKVGGAMTDRINGHVGACQAMDWRDNYGTDGDRKVGGWVVTAGVDRTIKIWDFSLPILSTRPVRTLYSFQPIQDVAWNPSKGTEIAATPMPSLGVKGGLEDGNAPGSAFNLELGDQPSFWKNEVEIWDTRRPYFPKLAIKTHDPISCTPCFCFCEDCSRLTGYGRTALTYHDEETVLCSSKSSMVFRQYDTGADTYSLLESLPRPSASWTVDGEFAFASGTRATNAVAWERQCVDLSHAHLNKKG